MAIEATRSARRGSSTASSWRRLGAAGRALSGWLSRPEQARQAFVAEVEPASPSPRGWFQRYFEQASIGIALVDRCGQIGRAHV